MRKFWERKKYNNVYQRGTICWLHFFNQAKEGHAHCGDYGYIQAYAPNHSKKTEDGELYVKVIIKEVTYLYGSVQFNLEIMNKNGSLSYPISVREPDRLTFIEWIHPSEVKWAQPLHHI